MAMRLRTFVFTCLTVLASSSAGDPLQQVVAALAVEGCGSAVESISLLQHSAQQTKDAVKSQTHAVASQADAPAQGEVAWPSGLRKEDPPEETEQREETEQPEKTEQPAEQLDEQPEQTEQPEKPEQTENLEQTEQTEQTQQTEQQEQPEEQPAEQPEQTKQTENTEKAEPKEEGAELPELPGQHSWQDIYDLLNVTAEKHQAVAEANLGAAATRPRREAQHMHGFVDLAGLRHFFTAPWDLSSMELFIFIVIYGLFLAFSTSTLTEGATLLLLIPAAAPVVEKVILPLVSVLPLWIFVLAGVHPLNGRLGLGAVIGSSFSLLSGFWLLTILAGRVPMTWGNCDYKRKADQASQGAGGIARAGIELKPQVKNNARLMFLAAFLCILRPQPLLCLMGLGFYTLLVAFSLSLDVDEQQLEVKGSPLTEEQIFTRALLPAQSRRASAAHLVDTVVPKYGLALYCEAVRGAAEARHESENARVAEASELLAQFPVLVKDILEEVFRRRSRGSGLDLPAFESALLELQIPHTRAKAQEVFQLAEAESDTVEYIDLMAFMLCVASLSSMTPEDGQQKQKKQQRRETKKGHKNQWQSAFMQSGSSFSSLEESDEEPELQPSWSDLPVAKQQQYILLIAFAKLLLGLVLLILFMCPFAEALADVGHRTGCMFYTSAFIAPLVLYSNEFASAYFYARQKTSRSATIAINTLTQTACLNNIVCLGTVFVQNAILNVQLGCHAELMVLFIVQVSMAIFAMRCRVHRTVDCIWIAMLMPGFMIASTFLHVLGVQ